MWFNLVNQEDGSMQLEAGKKYVDRRGRVYGPLMLCSVYFGESTGHAFWYSSGSVLRGCKSDLDLIAEYDLPAPVESPDDWVILPPEHVLRCRVDEIQYDDDPYDRWHPVMGADGYVVKDWGHAARCRRKDLPPVPPVKPARPVIDPGEGYRLLEPHEVTLPDDERAYFWAADDYSAWDELALCNPREFVGVTVESLLLSRKEISIRRKLPPKTRTVTLKEYVCWDDSDSSFVTIEWTSGDPSQSFGVCIEFDHAHPTGNERTIEISL
jgi:hypothetical protein